MAKKIFALAKICVLLFLNLIANGRVKKGVQKKFFVELNSVFFERKMPNYLLPIISKFLWGNIPKVSKSGKLAIELFRDASKSHKLASNSKIFRKFVISIFEASEIVIINFDLDINKGRKYLKYNL